MDQIQKYDGKALTEYRLTPEEIQERVSGFLQLAVPPDDRSAYKKAHEAKMVCVRTRTGIDKRRHELGEDARKWVAAVNDTAKQLTALVAPAEKHLVAELQAEDARLETIKREAEEKEAARVRGIRNRILDMVIQTGEAHKLRLPELENHLARVLVMEITEEEFQEFTEEASVNRNMLRAALEGMIGFRRQEEADWQAQAEKTRLLAEEQAKKAADLEADRARLAEEKRVADETARKDREALKAAQETLAEEKRLLAEEKRLLAEAQFEKDAAEAKAKITEIIRQNKEKHAKELEEAAAAEKARQEAMRPELEKVKVYLRALLAVEAPAVESEVAADWILTVRKFLVSHLDDVPF